MVHIMTHDPIRHARWQALFGTDILPVLSPTPRWQCVQEGNEARIIYAYDLDLRALGELAISRYAAWIAGRNQRRYEEVKSELSAAVSVPIKATNCEVVMTAEERPSLLYGWLVRIVSQFFINPAPETTRVY